VGSPWRVGRRRHYTVYGGAPCPHARTATAAVDHRGRRLARVPGPRIRHTRRRREIEARSGGDGCWIQRSRQSLLLSPKMDRGAGEETGAAPKSLGKLIGMIKLPSISCLPFSSLPAGARGVAGFFAGA